MGSGSGAPSSPDHRPRDIVVVGASAGGVQALRVLLAALPADLPAALFVVLHLPEASTSHLDLVLARSSVLPVATAQEGDEVRSGRVLVAPGGRHVLLRGPGVQVRQGQRKNGVRPSVDVLFGSAALTHGPRVVSLVLTGLLADGAAGTREVLLRGGLVLVQDPSTAEYESMPRQAIRAAPTAHVAELGRLAELVVGAVTGVLEPGRPAAARAVVPAGTIAPAGAVVPAGSRPTAGAVAPAGALAPGGTVVRGGTVVPGGTDAPGGQAQMPTAVSAPVGVGVRVEPRDDVALAADIAISAGDPPASRRLPASRGRP